MRFVDRVLFTVAVILLSACAPRVRSTPKPNPVSAAGGTAVPGYTPVPGAPTGVTAFVDVGVVPMDSERALTRQTVLVEGGRIRAIGPISEVAVPAGARRIDGHGKYLIPGLADMHVHLGFSFGGRWVDDSAMLEQRVERDLFLFLANGVTTVRNVDYYSTPTNGMKVLNATVRRLRSAAAAGARWSPLIYTSGRWKMLGDSQSIEQHLKAYKAVGYDFVKLHGEGGVLLDSIATAARHVGIPIMGHVGNDFSSNDAVLTAIALGYASVEHLTGYPGGGISDESVGPDTLKLPELVAATRQAGLWNCPTQIIYDLTDTNPARWPETRYYNGMYQNPFWRGDTATTPTLAPQKVTWLKLRRRIIKSLQEAGAGLLLGTDNPITVPGFGASRELQALVRAGLTPYQALATGTRNPAQFFDALAERGTVSVGKRADLVLLTGNPLADIHYTAHPAGVMIGGRWLSRRAIDRQFARYAVHGTACDPFHPGC